MVEDGLTRAFLPCVFTCDFALEELTVGTEIALECEIVVQIVFKGRDKTHKVKKTHYMIARVK
jgi:hypothetical protein